jgi:aminoglycoside phosphotransferase (APT) family kinase protein
MDPAPDTDDHAWPQVVSRIDPAGRLARVWSFPGGLSSAMTVLDVDAADGTRHRFVVRRLPPGAPRRRRSITREHALISRLHANGLPVPQPVALDRSREVLPGSYAVYRYVPGALRLTTDDPVGTGRQYAEQQAVIHAVDPAAFADLGLPDRNALVRDMDKAPADTDGALRDATMRAALAEHRSLLDTGPRRLLHGDFWPGNVLFEGPELVAVLDWEGACLGDPLADVAITRLDLWWAYGRAAANAFTDHYLSLTGADPTALPVWQLVAALRPVGFVSMWAADWVRQGRPDITPAHLRAVHRQYLDEALACLT